MRNKVIPPSLLEIQTWFGKMIARPLGKPAANIEKWITPGPHLTPQQRLAIYNEQYWLRLFIILQKDYPTLLRLFGPQDFNQLIGEPYLLKYPPRHWSLRFLGSRLPQWIEKDYQEEDKILVSQVAQIEAAFISLFFLKDKNLILTLNANLFAFREQLLEKEPNYWTEHPFPKIDWGKKRRYLVSANGYAEI